MKYITNIIRILFLALFIFLLANGKVLLWLALFAVSLVAANKASQSNTLACLVRSKLGCGADFR